MFLRPLVQRLLGVDFDSEAVMGLSFSNDLSSFGAKPALSQLMQMGEPEMEDRPHWWVRVDLGHGDVLRVPLVAVDDALVDGEMVRIRLGEFIDRLTEWASETAFGWGRDFRPSRDLSLEPVTIEPT